MSVKIYPREVKKLDDLKDHPKNPRAIDKEAFKGLKNSLSEFGYLQPIVWNKRSGYIVSGHQRLQALKKLGETDSEVIVVDFDDETERKAIIQMNSQKISGYFDDEVLAEIAEGLDFGEDDPLLLNELLKDEIEDWSDNQGGDEDGESVYTSKIESPIYEITGEKPKIEELAEADKVNQMLEKIDSAEISDDMKMFLRLAAMRHVRFDFSKIAEYYAHADEVVQELFEENALVIIDFDQAIANGFAKMSDEVADIYEDSKD